MYVSPQVFFIIFCDFQIFPAQSIKMPRMTKGAVIRGLLAELAAAESERQILHQAFCSRTYPLYSYAQELVHHFDFLPSYRVVASEGLVL